MSRHDAIGWCAVAVGGVLCVAFFIRIIESHRNRVELCGSMNAHQWSKWSDETPQSRICERCNLKEVAEQ